MRAHRLIILSPAIGLLAALLFVAGSAGASPQAGAGWRLIPGAAEPTPPPGVPVIGAAQAPPVAQLARPASGEDDWMALVTPRSQGGEPLEPWQMSGAAGLALSAPAANGLIAQLDSESPLPSLASFAVCYDTARVWGVAGPGETVTVTVSGAQAGAARADGIGFFWTTLYDASGSQVSLTPGDQVSIFVNGALAAEHTLLSISGSINQVADTVSGVIGAGGPGSVTVYAGSSEPSRLAYTVTASTDGGGNFDADFSGTYDFLAWDQALVAYVQDGIEVHRHVLPGDASMMVRPSPFNWVAGIAPMNATITATLYQADGVTVKDWASVAPSMPDGWYIQGFSEPIEVGDVVAVELENGTVLSRTIDTLTMEIDPNSDTISGQAAPFALLRSFTFSLTDIGQMTFFATTTADAVGSYTLDYSGAANLLPGQSAWVMVADAEGDDINLRWQPPSVDVNQTWNEVSGFAPAPAGTPDESWPITLTLYSAATDEILVYNRSIGWGGNYTFNQGDDGLPDIQPGDVVTVESEGYAWQGVVAVQTMSAEPDLDANLISGSVEMPGTRVELDIWNPGGHLWPVNGYYRTLAEASSPFSAPLAGFDLIQNANYDVVHRTPDEYAERVSLETGGFGALLPNNTVLANLQQPGVAFTITLRDSQGGFKASVSGISEEPNGFSGWHDFWGSGERILAGDHVILESELGYSQTLIIPDLQVAADLDDDIVSGIAPANTRLWMSVDAHGQGLVSSGADGSFQVQASQLQEMWGDGDLQWGDNFGVQWWDENNNWVWQALEWPVIVAEYDMNGSNGVRGWNAAPGSTVQIVVKDALDATVAEGSAAAGGCDWCGPTDYWLPLPDGTLAPGHRVIADFGGGLTSEVTVVALTGAADPDTDMLTGTAPPNGRVNVWADCRHGGCWSQIRDIEVDGDGNFAADFWNAGDPPHDIQPGDNFGIEYNAPYGHYVQYNFWLPAPDLAIWKWRPGGGQAAPGGVVVYVIQYANQGNGTAENTVIVDQLPNGTTWFGDTSGLPSVEAGGVITWQVGDLPPGEVRYFAVTLAVADDAPDPLAANCASIDSETGDDTDPGNNTSCSDEVSVSPADAGVNVDKWPRPHDPAPGEMFEYTIRWCSDGPAATGPVWLTETLPVSTTLVSWEPQNWNESFWVEQSATAGQLVLYAPGLPGNYCEHMRLTLLVDADAPLGTVLANHVVLDNPGDDYPDNNERLNEDARVGAPRYDLRTGKWFGGGVLTPGGWARFGVRVENHGNSPLHTWLTDTLPAGMTYQPGSAHYDNGQPAAPVSVNGNEIVWDLGEIAVNGYAQVDFQANVDAGVTPGTTLNNCAVAGGGMPEATPDDNSACASVTINEPGPNLRVIKWHWWNGDGQLGYQIQFDNIGDQQVDQVWITDTLPAATTWDGWWNMGFDWNRLEETPAGGSQLVWRFSTLYPGDSGWLQFNANLDDPNARPAWYTNTVEITMPPGDTTPADNVYVDAVVRGEMGRVDVRVGRDNAELWGDAAPGSTVTVTTAFRETTTTTGQPGCDTCWNIWDAGPIWPGDTLTVTSGQGLMPVVIHLPDPFEAQGDSDLDRVAGQAGGLNQEWIEVDHYGFGTQNVQTDADGFFEALYDDLPRGANGEIRYRTTINYAEVTLHRDWRTLDVTLNINYGHDWIEGNYEAGHVITLTVTDGGGSLRAATTLPTEVIPWWGGSTGFSTNHNAVWLPSHPNIQPGDWVHAEMSNGHSASVRIGTVDGDVDSAADTVLATISVDWFAGVVDSLHGQCSVWVDGGPAIDFTFDPAGDSSLCDFGAIGWDVQQGQPVAVMYWEPDGHQVINMPGTDIGVDKSGHANPAPGGNYIYRIHYYNHTHEDAQDVVITDLLPPGLTYLGDTSGWAAVPVGDNDVAWTVGVLAAHTDSFFDVFVAVDSGLTPGDELINRVEIETSSHDTNPDNNAHEWSTWVVDNDTNLSLGKHAWTLDPAPGADFVYVLNICNNTSTGSGSSLVTLTDTLPAGVSLVDWWAPEYWDEVNASPGELVISRLSFPGWACSDVYLIVHLDEAANPGDSLLNTATLHAANDLNPDDNSTEMWLTVGAPHTNLLLGKQWGGGVLTPGGQFNTQLHYGNNGNLPVAGPIRITDTLPAHTTYVSAWRNDWSGGHAIEPVEQGAGYVVWELDGLPNGYSGQLNVTLAIDSDAPAGLELVNTAEIQPQPAEDTYDDNASAWNDVVHGHGPNLRVRKTGGWHGHGEGHNAWYTLELENVGDEAVDMVSLTDVYPAEMVLDGGINADGGKWWDWADDPGSHSFTATVDNLNPGEMFHFYFNTVIPGGDPVPPGLLLTNTVQLMEPPGDTNPDDNAASLTLFTGPDLFVSKDLTEGELLAGQLVTFTLTFGNNQASHAGWWNPAGNAWLTDTLPAELAFEWASVGPALVDGQDVVWELGHVPSGAWSQIQVTARLTDSAAGGDAFANTAAIGSDNPQADIDPLPANNQAIYDMLVEGPNLAVSKTYDSSQAAGAVVTYTLTVTNSGTLTATNASLEDHVPTAVTYGGGGAHDAGVVTWLLPSIAPNGGTATAWFSGTLSCTPALVENADYQVAGSDGGFTSGGGPTVSFTSQAPDIQVSLNHAPASPAAGATVSFTATASSNGGPLAYAWDFDDGDTAAGGLARQHTFDAPGSYTVTFTATDGCGYHNAATTQVNVAAPALAANFSYAPMPANILTGQSVSFTDTSTTNGAPIAAWAWTFGDGAASASQNPAHTYTQAGVYTVTLTVTDTLGYSDTETKTSIIRVSDSCQAITAVGFSHQPATALVNMPLTFTAVITPSTATPPLTYAWDFGDGVTTTTSLASVTHTYAQWGDRAVQVTVSNACTVPGVSASRVVAVNARRLYLPLVQRGEP